jgi:hypothetical protein
MASRPATRRWSGRPLRRWPARWLARSPGLGSFASQAPRTDCLLITELALFLLVLAAWLAAGSHPAGISALTLLALVSVALGGESIWALRIHQTTTYFTGMLTKTVNAAVSANADVGTSLRREALTETGLAERIEPPSLAHAAPGSGNRLVTTLAGGAALRSHRMPESASPRP